MHRPCQHPQWLEIADVDSESFTLTTSDRLARLFEQIPNRLEVKPSLFLLLGSHNKNATLSSLLSLPLPKTSRGRRGFRAYLEPHSILSTRPVILIDGDLRRCTSTPCPTELRCHLCTRTNVRRSPWGAHPTGPAYQVCSSLLIPFVEVVCLFVDDHANLESVADQLGSLLERGPSSTMPASARPQLLLVTEKPRVATMKRLNRLLSERTSRPMTSVFSDWCMLQLPRVTRRAPQVRFLRIRERLFKASSQVRAIRKEKRYLFSAPHLAEFFTRALTHLQKDDGTLFDFIQWSRYRNPTSPNLESHLYNFLSGYNALNNITVSGLPIIATSLLFNHYLPEAHVFDPVDVFETLHSARCREAFGKLAVLDEAGRAHMLTRVRQKFVEFFMLHGSDPSRSVTEYHLSNIGRFPGHWKRTFSSSTCLLCIQSTPESQLVCGHRICMTCVQIFGESNPADPWRFTISHCPLCRVFGPTVIGMKPRTARSRLLSIDGGGQRVAGVLEFWRILEKRTGLTEFFANSFDMAGGTSIGGFAVLSVFLKGWSEKDCSQAFERLFGMAFTPHVHSPWQFLSWVLNTAISVAVGSRYPAHGIDEALQTVFGLDQTIDQPSFASRQGVKIALPVVSVPGNLRHLFNNYNGFHRSASPGSTHCHDTLSAPEMGLGVRLWEIARAITAAPGYFPTHYIKSLGKNCSDGATWENNPVRIITREARALDGGVEPALVVSMGTGSSRSSVSSPWPCGPLGRFVRGSVAGRLWDWLETIVHGQPMWEEFLADNPKLQQDGRLHRLTWWFREAVAGLDDWKRAPEIRGMVKQQHEESQVIDDLIDACVVEMFYFELVEKPKAGKSVRANVWCRWKNVPGNGYAKWLEYIRKRQIQVILNDAVPRSFETDQFGNLVCPLSCAELDKKTSVQIRLGIQAPRHIGGSPFLTSDLRQCQGLDTSMGILENAGRKRKAPTGVEEPVGKRVRLQRRGMVRIRRRI